MSPVSVDYYGYFAALLSIIGLAFMAAFFTIGVRAQKNFLLELLLAAFASVFLGIGSLFIFLYAEIYV